jgi:hypothetical protein
MMRLMRRVVVMWLVLSVLSASVVVVARLNRVPSRLQAFGFDLCAGEPCWRGLKPGISVDALRSAFPDFNANLGILNLRQGRWSVSAEVSGNRAIVQYMYVSILRPNPSLPVGAGEIVERFGAPCGIGLDETLVMIYPTMSVQFARRSLSNPGDKRLELNSSPYMIMMRGTPNSSSDDCFWPDARYGIYPWQGFTSVEKYLAPVRRAHPQVYAP